jgi:hypothetical protein
MKKPNISKQKCLIRRVLVNLDEELHKVGAVLPAHWVGMSAADINEATAEWRGDKSRAKLTSEMCDLITNATARVVFAEKVNQAVQFHIEGKITTKDYIAQVKYLEEWFLEDLLTWPIEEL